MVIGSSSTKNYQASQSITAAQIKNLGSVGITVVAVAGARTEMAL